MDRERVPARWLEATHEEPDGYDYEGERLALQWAMAHEPDGYVPKLATEQGDRDYTGNGTPARAKPATARRAGRHWHGPPMGEADIEAALKVAPQDGRWHKMNQDFLSILDADGAVLLSFLLNWRQRWQEDMPQNMRLAGWFYCTIESMEDHLWWGGKKQGRELAKLKARGYIEVEQHRRPSSNGQPVRHVKILYANIARDLATAWQKKLNTRTAFIPTAAPCMA